MSDYTRTLGRLEGYVPPAIRLLHEPDGRAILVRSGEHWIMVWTYAVLEMEGYGEFAVTPRLQSDPPLFHVTDIATGCTIDSRAFELHLPHAYGQLAHLGAHRSPEEVAAAREKKGLAPLLPLLSGSEPPPCLWPDDTARLRDAAYRAIERLDNYEGDERLESIRDELLAAVEEAERG